VVRVLDGIDAFLDQLTSVEPLPAFLAVLAHVAKLACTSMAWRNVLAAAYPDRAVRWVSIYGAYLAGVGVNAIVPVRAGDAVRIVLAHRAIPGSTYTTVVSSTLVLSIFDMAAGIALLTWAAVSLDELPGLGELPQLPTFDFAWFLDHPLAAELILAGVLIALAIFGWWISGHVANFWDRVRQAFEVVTQPPLYLRSVAAWQAADWSLRLVTIWFLLDAFGIPQSLENVLLVQVSSSIATLIPLTPSGIGTEQAFLLYVFRGAVSASDLLAFSVGMRLTTVTTNLLLGFTAIALTLRTIRVKRAIDPNQRLRT
jgi:uncharacterized membrane protein YbhN (UPF0104 family)